MPCGAGVPRLVGRQPTWPKWAVPGTQAVSWKEQADLVPLVNNTCRHWGSELLSLHPEPYTWVPFSVLFGIAVSPAVRTESSDLVHSGKRFRRFLSTPLLSPAHLGSFHFPRMTQIFFCGSYPLTCQHHLVGITLGSIKDKQELVAEPFIAMTGQSDSFEKWCLASLTQMNEWLSLPWGWRFTTW